MIVLLSVLVLKKQFPSDAEENLILENFIHCSDRLTWWNMEGQWGRDYLNISEIEHNSYLFYVLTGKYLMLKYILRLNMKFSGRSF